MELSFARIINLIKRSVAIQGRSLITIISSITGVILVISVLSNINNMEVNFQTMVVLFYIMTMIGGFWFTSNIFNELHKPSKAYKFLTLPASNFEKMLSSWFITSFGIIVVSFLLINITSLLLALLCSVFFNSAIRFPDVINDYRFWEVMLKYIVIQPIFLLGASMFRKNNFFKTILSVIIIAFILGACAALMGYLILPKGYWFNQESIGQVPVVIDFFEGPFTKTAEIVFWGIMWPFFLVASYFRLKESEI